MGKYKTKITEYGYELINNVLSSNKILITNGWHIALGTGELEPDFKTTRLNNIVFDKNSADYPGIIISKCNKGRYAEIVIPESLAGMVITEIGLFDEKNGLVACANTKLDCTERTEEGFDIDYRARIDLGAVDSDVVIEFQGGTFQLLEEKGEAGGYAPLDDKKKVPLKHLQCPYIPFCFNSGAVDENGEAALLELSTVTEMVPPESDGEEPGQVEHKFVTLKAPAVYTDGNGKTVNITENLTLDVTDSEPGKYSLRVAENNGIIKFFTINAQVYKQKTPPENPVNGDLWQNLSVAPSIVYKYDAASQEWLPNCNEVEAGTYTVTENSGNSDLSGGGGGKLVSNPYNIQNISGDKIGIPIPVFSNDLDEGYIWLEGAEVSKTAYNKLYEVYGDDYGTPLNPENFVLPDCRGRVLWGSPDGRFGYLEATAPNITGNSYASFITAYDNAPGSQGAIVETSYVRNTPCSNSRYGGYITWMFNAHNSNPIYQDGATLRPPSIKCRVQTRYR